MVIRKSVQKPLSRVVGRKSEHNNEANEFCAKVEADIAGFLEGREYKTRTIDGVKYFCLVDKNKIFKIVKFSKAIHQAELQVCFESLLVYQQAKDNKFIQLLELRGEYESFVFFENPKCFKYIQSSLKELSFIITKTHKLTDRSELISDRTIVKILYLLDKISKDVNPNEKLKMIQHLIARKFSRSLDGIDLGDDSYELDGQVYKLNHSKLKTMFNNLEKAGAVFPHNGLTFNQLIAGHSTSDVRLSQYLRVRGDAVANRELQENASRFMCQSIMGEMFYLNPEVNKNK